MTVSPKLHRLGNAMVPVLEVDGLEPALRVANPVALAAALAPFPAAGNNYPGLRRVIGEGDAAAMGYVVALLEAASPYLAGAFDLDRFELVEASFSLVTTPAAALSPVQRAPHFDGPDPDTYAVLHYLADCAGTGFYRHRETGVEVVTAQNLEGYVSTARRTPAPGGYIAGDTPGFAMTGKVEGRAGRLAAYPANVLHSGIIPAHFVPSADPAKGRLTTNIFIRGHRG